MKSIEYKYGHMPIPGGGYVTGFCYHPLCAGILYCRTDVGGAYRYDYLKDCWVSLMDRVTHTDTSASFVTALALDKNYPERLYMACGVNDHFHPRNGVFASSEDYGRTFTYYEIPCVVHGNFPGRGTGNRLVVDPNNSDIIYFANQRGGLMRSLDRGAHWETLSIADGSRANESNCTFIWVCPSGCDNGQSRTLILGTSGIDNSTENGCVRGHSLYVSYDTGKTWQELSMPTANRPDNTKVHGFVAQRYDYDGKYLYVTLSANGPKSQPDVEGYSCDSGDACNGKIIRYPVNSDGKLDTFQDITPCGTVYGYGKDRINECGFGGICSTPQVPGLLAASTLCERRGDMVFISRDYGEHWEVSLYGLQTGNMHFKTSYMQPRFNGGHSLIHWLSDIKINPFDADDVLFNTGTGVFGTHSFTQNQCSWCDRCEGIEETVHLNVYSPHEGEVIAIDAVGDLGGFAFTETGKPCVNSFSDDEDNRYITCINADYPDDNPDRVVVTARGNWSGKTIGGLILSDNQCKNFRHIDLPFGIDEYIDSLLHRIAMVNHNSGWVTISADGNTIVWTLADRIFLPIKAVLVSSNGGKTFSRARFYDLSGNETLAGYAKVFADRQNPLVMYAFDTTRIIYISKDGGYNFYQCAVPEYVPEYPLSLIDTPDKSSLCPERGKNGIFYMALGVDGIWKMMYNVTVNELTFTRLTDEGRSFYRIGLGIGRNDDFLSGAKTIYAAASIDGIYGFYRSDNDGSDWIRINDDDHMFGQINCICGDSRVYGRFYIATGSRGLLYGEPL